MRNPTAIVTGGAKRLGRAMSLSLAERGFDIVIHYNRSKEEASRLSEEIRGMGRQCRLLQADFADLDSVEETAKKLFSDGEDCQVLINNASIFNPMLFDKTPLKDLTNNFSVHFFYPFFLTKFFAEKYAKGVVINILDSRITDEDIEFFPYTLSKKSLASFTRMSARALAPDIRVNAICPGPVLPPGFDEPQNMEKKVSRLPLQKAVAIPDIIRALDYLLDNESVTGEFLFVDGGMHLTNIT
ncbi:MAG TPA: SDR family NAD(P)-dependent oxidoreductase [Balneolales bacterium]|nr:SDR family NAD(P)-dependent oxidoreductase [Balneolales bacterium]